MDTAALRSGGQQCTRKMKREKCTFDQGSMVVPTDVPLLLNYVLPFNLPFETVVCTLRAGV